MPGHPVTLGALTTSDPVLVDADDPDTWLELVHCDALPARVFDTFGSWK